MPSNVCRICMRVVFLARAMRNMADARLVESIECSDSSLLPVFRNSGVHDLQFSDEVLAEERVQVFAVAFLLRHPRQRVAQFHGLSGPRLGRWPCGAFRPIAGSGTGNGRCSVGSCPATSSIRSPLSPLICTVWTLTRTCPTGASIWLIMVRMMLTPLSGPQLNQAFSDHRDRDLTHRVVRFRLAWGIRIRIRMGSGHLAAELLLPGRSSTAMEACQRLGCGLGLPQVLHAGQVPGSPFSPRSRGNGLRVALDPRFANGSPRAWPLPVCPWGRSAVRLPPPLQVGGRRRPPGRLPSWLGPEPVRVPVRLRGSFRSLDRVCVLWPDGPAAAWLAIWRALSANCPCICTASRL